MSGPISPAPMCRPAGDRSSRSAISSVRFSSSSPSSGPGTKRMAAPTPPRGRLCAPSSARPHCQFSAASRPWRRVCASQGVGDLVDVETGVRDAGATISTIPDLWERRDVRAEMTYAVQGLIEHLNEHVEYYTNNILWNLDRNKLWMLIDGFYVPGT